MSSRTGWGVFGINLALQLSARRIPAISFIEPIDLDLPPAKERALAQVLDWQKQATAMLPPEPERVLTCPYPVMHALGNGLTTTSVSRKVAGQPDIGMVFMEDCAVTATIRRRAERFRLMLAGSSWNARLLQEGGIAPVVACPQGVDTQMFDAEGEAFDFGGRFTVFSGGKLEYRKGQDMVIAAFREFLNHDPDALLATAWHSYWPDATPWPSAHVIGQPEAGSDGRLRLTEWVVDNGIPERNFLDLGAPPNSDMPAIFRGANAGLFTNRAEGGTNLVAMEAMATGLPCILSANTGHLDLLGDGNCIPLGQQGSCSPFGEFSNVGEWGESDIGEAVAALIRLRDDQAAAHAIGQSGHRFMQDWSWADRIDAMISAIEGVV